MFQFLGQRGGGTTRSLFGGSGRRDLPVKGFCLGSGWAFQRLAGRAGGCYFLLQRFSYRRKRAFQHLAGRADGWYLLLQGFGFGRERALQHLAGRPGGIQLF